MKRLYEAVGQDGGYAAVGFNYDQATGQQEQQPVIGMKCIVHVFLRCSLMRV